MLTPESQAETTPRLRAMIAATTMAASLALSGYATGEEVSADTATSISSDTSEASFTSGASECLPAVNEDIHAVKKLMSHPQSLTASIKNVAHKHTIASEFAAKRLVTAKHLDLTVYNYQHAYNGLLKDAQHKSRKPISTYMQNAGKFAQRYGVTVTAPNVMPENTTGEPIAPIDMNNLTPGEQKYARIVLASLISNIGELPVEFVKGVGLKHIYLVKIGKIATTAFADQTSGDAIYIDPRKRIDPLVYLHEFAHLWDAQVCGGPIQSFQDPGFDALNPVNVYSQYPYDMARHTDRQNYTDEYTVIKSVQAVNLQRQMRKDHANHNSSLAKQHSHKYNALFKHVVTPTPYALTNIAEDKATVGEALFDSYDYKSIYNKRQPILANKFVELMARIYDDYPRVAKYLIQVGNSKF